MSISVKTSWQNLQNKLHNFTKWKYFNEFYAAIFMFIALFSWRFNSLVGMFEHVDACHYSDFHV